MNVSRIGCRTTLAALVVWVAVAPIGAQVPQVMNYQGRLLNNNPQQDAVNDTVPIVFRIYGSATGSDLLWTEIWPTVDVVDGVFDVLLGSNGNPLSTDLFAGGSQRWLELLINGETLRPRQRIGSAGWAHVAERARDVACSGCVNGNDVANGSLTYADTDTNSIQRRVTGACPENHSIRSIGATGTVTCDRDTLLSYTQEFSVAAYNGATDLAIVERTGRNVCFLTHVQLRDVDSGGEDAYCRIYALGGSPPTWVLEARSEDDSDAFCTMRCVEWSP